MANSGDTGVIDVHAHFIPDAYRAALASMALTSLDGGMPIPDWSPQMAIDVMDRAGIGKAILSVSSPGMIPFDAVDQAKLARAINEEGAQIIADHPDRFGGFATLPLGDIDASLAEIDHALDVLRLDGFIMETNHKGLYPSDEKFAPVLAALNARKAVVLLHPTSPHCAHCAGHGRPAPLIEFPFDTTRAVVEMIYTGTLSRFPGIRFILAHAGGTLPFLAQRIAGFTALPVAGTDEGISPPIVMKQLQRLYYDTALSTTIAQMGALRHLVPVEQILFGSDWPFSPEVMLSGSIAALKAEAIFDDADRAAIFGGNATRLLTGA